MKDRYSGINMRDYCRQPWTKNCIPFKKLAKTCDVISSCAWSGGRGPTQKLTKQTAEALVLSTRANIEAAEWLLTQHNFIYMLPGEFADEAHEKFFGQARQRNVGNFYIADIKAVAETKNLHALLKYESMPHKSNNVPCTSNIRINDYDFDITIADTEDLVQSNDSIKHKIIFLAGYLEHKFRGKSLETENIDDHYINSDFVTNLNRGGLTVPLLSAAHFVHLAYKLFDKCNLHCCRTHLSQTLHCIDSPVVAIQRAGLTLPNIFFESICARQQ